MRYSSRTKAAGADLGGVGTDAGDWGAGIGERGVDGGAGGGLAGGVGGGGLAGADYELGAEVDELGEASRSSAKPLRRARQGAFLFLDADAPDGVLDLSLGQLASASTSPLAPPASATATCACSPRPSASCASLRSSPDLQPIPTAAGASAVSADHTGPFPGRRQRPHILSYPPVRTPNPAPACHHWMQTICSSSRIKFNNRTKLSENDNAKLLIAQLEFLNKEGKLPEL
ncbi:unnamed protein product [Miscanthus lutarioriparius]|uniref:Uncharacterized protein n=1 Tax=Miscanthus lutarioriparius TaxID=422564 RepID=A0A811NBY1_9POAL|nr:unnamed protein product [Miscanthus lutarioriparius]